jgi:hypothetical protein
VASFGRDTRNQRHGSGAKFRYFSREWEDLGPLRDPDRFDSSIALPNNPADLVRAAETVAAELPAIFVRVDLFETPSEVYFGEITPQPGTLPWFGPEVDRFAGELWDAAEAKLLGGGSV